MGRKGDFCLAVKRTDRGKIMLRSPDGEFKQFEEEDILGLQGVYLGHFCRADYSDGIKRFESIEHRNLDLKVTVFQDTVKIENVSATVISQNNAKFYRSEDFGVIACLDEDVSLGEKVKITVKLLDEEEQVGSYTHSVWGGLFQKTVAHSNGPTSSNVNRNRNSSGFPLVEDLNLSDSDSSDESSDDIEIVGIIFGCDLSKNRYFIWCKENLTRKNGMIISKDKLELGQWIKMKFTKKAYDRFFPKGAANPPPFFTKKFSLIDGYYPVKVIKQSVVVEIEKLDVKNGHASGSTLIDGILGKIKDSEQLIRAGRGSYKITVERGTRSGPGFKNYWKVTKCDNVNNEGSSSSNIKNRPIPQKVNKFKIGQTSIAQTSENHRKSELTNGGPRPLYHPMQGTPFMTNPAFPVPPFFGYPPFISPQSYSQSPNPMFHHNKPEKGTMNGENNAKVHKGFQESRMELVPKRALITSVKNSKNGTVCYLWLIDDHQQSIYHVTKNEKYETGHFFRGGFAKKHNKWECYEKIETLGQLLHGERKYNSFISLEVEVEKYYDVDQSENALYPEIYHKFLGRIVVADRATESELAIGSKVWVCLTTVNGLEKHTWATMKKPVSHKLHLITAFDEVWKLRDVRGIVSKRHPNDVQILDKFYNIHN